MDLPQLYRGLLRGFTSDVVGAPVDLAEQLANLGLAGYGYAGHKLGLLDASQLPELLEASPGTSEWFARKAGNPDTGSGEYLAGRLTPAALGLAKAAAPGLQKGLVKAMENAQAPVKRGPGSSQRGAIRVGGADDLYLGHTRSITPTNPKLNSITQSAPILYGHSFGLTAGKVPNYGNIMDSPGGLLLLPRLNALDPASYDTRLWNRDAYVSRSRNHLGRRWIEEGATFREAAPQLLRDRGLAQQNIMKSEGSEPIPPNYKLYSPENEGALFNSPKFRSFADFEASPAGAAVLRDTGQGGRVGAMRLAQNYSTELREIALRHFPNASSHDFYELTELDKLLIAPPEFRKKVLGEIASRSPEFAREVADLAKRYRQAYAQLPSEYGELQNYGALPITPDNFAGAIVTEQSPGTYSDSVKRAVGRLPVMTREPGQVKTSDLDELLSDAGPARTARKGLTKVYMPPAVAKPQLTPAEQDIEKQLIKAFGAEWAALTPASQLVDEFTSLSSDQQQAFLQVLEKMVAATPWKNKVLQDFKRLMTPAPDKVGPPNLNLDVPAPIKMKPSPAKPLSTAQLLKEVPTLQTSYLINKPAKEWTAEELMAVYEYVTDQKFKGDEPLYNAWEKAKAEVSLDVYKAWLSSI